MLSILNMFRKDEDGAVTVDWVVLTALIVGIAFVLLTQIQGATNALGTSISTEMGNITVGAGG
ncbi:Flp family type IVb pilin [Aestuariibius insulae]|uniref:Flp family type IVb pilin n=1 Tax=Aestuariibius insulae TaxID=2058287 RepID=UPI00345E6E76